MKKTKNIVASTVLAGTLALQGTILEAQTGSKAKLNATESIRPFKINFSDAALKDLRNRILATKWPKKENEGEPKARPSLFD